MLTMVFRQHVFNYIVIIELKVAAVNSHLAAASANHFNWLSQRTNSTLYTCDHMYVYIYMYVMDATPSYASIITLYTVWAEELCNQSHLYNMCVYVSQSKNHQKNIHGDFLSLLYIMNVTVDCRFTTGRALLLFFAQTCVPPWGHWGGRGAHGTGCTHVLTDW